MSYVNPEREHSKLEVFGAGLVGGAIPLVTSILLGWTETFPDVFYALGMAIIGAALWLFPMKGNHPNG